MFLKRIELFGFKSFAEKTVIEFTDGITALLGPNGCGKSNIVDSVKWVLGEQRAKSIRAEKQIDVIFNGTDNRKPLNAAEVTLIIDNEQGHLDMDSSEIAIKRRCYRSGESEYFVNNMPVRLKEIREIFYDTGVGKSAYSIMEQGKIDQLLSNKPEERRGVFEEAAGITKYKNRQDEARRKLEHTETNMENIEGILGEVRKQYESLKIQSEKTLRYREKQDQLFHLDLDMSLLKLKTLNEREEKKENKLNDTISKVEEREHEAQQLEAELQSNRDKMGEMKTQENETRKRLYGMDIQKETHDNEYKLLKEREHELGEENGLLCVKEESLKEKIAASKKEREGKETESIEVQSNLKEIEENITKITGDINGMLAEMKSNREAIEGKKAFIEDAELRREERNIELREITDDIVAELDLGLKEANFSSSDRQKLDRDVAETIKSLKIQLEGKKEIIGDIKKIDNIDTNRLKGIFEEHQTSYGEMNKLISTLEVHFKNYSAMIPSFLEKLLAPEGIVTRKRAIDKEMDDIVKEVKEARVLIDQLNGKNHKLQENVEESRHILGETNINRATLQSRLDSLRDIIKNLVTTFFEQEERLKEVGRQIEGNKDKITSNKERMARLEEEKEDLDKEKISLIEELAILDKTMKDDDASMADKNKRLINANDAKNKLLLEKERLSVEIDHLKEEIYRLESQFKENYSQSLSEHQDRIEQITATSSELRDQVQALKQELRKLEQGLNLLAPEEFKEIESRYEFLNGQLSDLKQAKEDLEKVTSTIQAETEILFQETFVEIKKNFHHMVRKLFGGGRATIELTDESNVLTSGIEISVEPPGKSAKNIALLSGGERSLAGLALLFSIYIVKPSPFCILDEVDAPLDEANIQRFTGLLGDFKDNSQFIVITHNKKTVVGASALLGVTMQESGVSTVISMQLKEDLTQQTETG